GVEIPYVKGLLGHSDGDVLLHAICDALLGAASIEDIGSLFPDTDPKYHGAASKEFLEGVGNLLKERRFKISNIDTVIVAQEPTISPFRKQIQQSIASILKIKDDQINIKAKTNEGMGEIGKKEAIACYAVALLAKGE
ncbi:MAG: 2-C-methyl-D-erythritol 2,4-cyclodiphosphate synthase, partial [Candidatus Omnitrophica bacterium]|nr:2-C-methyl-D-erythritol 2,4-cyclodiphosphate synthase [Candidatus Omnitrophota bacterium]